MFETRPIADGHGGEFGDELCGPSRVRVNQYTSAVGGCRLQAGIDGEARATVTSFAGFATEVLVLGVFAAYAAGSQVADHATTFAVLASVYLPVAVWLGRSDHASPIRVADR